MNMEMDGDGAAKRCVASIQSSLQPRVAVKKKLLSIPVCESSPIQWSPTKKKFDAITSKRRLLRCKGAQG